MSEICKVSIMAPAEIWSQTIEELAQLVTKTVTTTVSASGRVHSHSEVSVVMSDARELHILNKEYRGIDATTNVLSFPGDELDTDEGSFTSLGRPMVLGDIVVAFEVIRDEAADQGKAIENHLAHMLVHGTLHLCGYDHEKSKKNAKAMEDLERQILLSMGVADPYEAPAKKPKAKAKSKSKSKAKPKKSGAKSK
ncbi:MAG: rRNA maturation RNase YbeY [Alphaproteobacteria bacterium]|jgi:probable rRNA maturation factor|nr:rRNA maturation RNase YbeY [Alphaproteobacteria bacterium]